MDKQFEGALDPQAATFVVIGGGIAGVTCAETLAVCCPNEPIILLTESNVIKTVTNLEPIARYLYKFDIKELSTSDTSHLQPSIVTIVDQLKHIATKQKKIYTYKSRCISYQYICICTGGQPHLISHDKHVIGIRDTDSVVEMQKRLHNAATIVLVGNGGIASELAYELKNVEVHWVVKDNHIASTFIDPGAAHFFQKALSERPEEENQETKPAVIKRLRYDEVLLEDEVGNVANKNKECGAALGPDWHRKFTLTGGLSKTTVSGPIMHYKEQIQTIVTNPKESNEAIVTLISGKTINCNFVVSATGVDPKRNFSSDQPFNLAATDNGILVNEMMETSIPCIYAAGDVCTANWEQADHWFQMRLWTQARQMGAMAGRSIAAAFQGEKVYQDFCFELFGHVTQLFGFSVILLGRYNGQSLAKDYELLIRSTPGKEYIKFVLQRGRLRGAILIGNTELAETCENLILNGIDLTPFGDDILNPDIDIEDYFD